MSALNDSSILKLCSESNLQTHRFDYEFIIDEISTRKNGFCSDTFSPPGMLVPKFYLQCDLNQITQPNAIYLIVVEKRSNVYVALNMKVLDVNDRELFKKEFKSQKITKSIELYSKPNNHNLLSHLPDDKVKIICEFTFKIDSFDNRIVPRNEDLKKIRDSSYIKRENIESALSPNQQIALDYDILLKSEKCFDVKLEVGRKIFKAHKIVLAARSPVFAAMFEHDCEENRSNRVEITDVGPKTFELILRYIYTSIIPPMEDNNVVEILAAADKYQLGLLKVECANKIKSKFSMDTVFDALIIADTYNAAKLKQDAIDYISSQRDMQTALKKLFTNHQTDQLIEAMRGIAQSNK